MSSEHNHRSSREHDSEKRNYANQQEYSDDDIEYNSPSPASPGSRRSSTHSMNSSDDHEDRPEEHRHSRRRESSRRNSTVSNDDESERRHRKHRERSSDSSGRINQNHGHGEHGHRYSDRTATTDPPLRINIHAQDQGNRHIEVEGAGSFAHSFFSNFLHHKQAKNLPPEPPKRNPKPKVTRRASVHSHGDRRDHRHHDTQNSGRPQPTTNRRASHGDRRHGSQPVEFTKESRDEEHRGRADKKPASETEQRLDGHGNHVSNYNNVRNASTGSASSSHGHSGRARSTSRSGTHHRSHSHPRYHSRSESRPRSRSPTNRERNSHQHHHGQNIAEEPSGTKSPSTHIPSTAPSTDAPPQNHQHTHPHTHHHQHEEPTKVDDRDGNRESKPPEEHHHHHRDRQSDGTGDGGLPTSTSAIHPRNSAGDNAQTHSEGLHTHTHGSHLHSGTREDSDGTGAAQRKPAPVSTGTVEQSSPEHVHHSHKHASPPSGGRQGSETQQEDRTRDPGSPVEQKRYRSRSRERTTAGGLERRNSQPSTSPTSTSTPVHHSRHHDSGSTSAASSSATPTPARRSSEPIPARKPEHTKKSAVNHSNSTHKKNHKPLP